jgi:nitroimidazol reductase NimA-like FMN-containing flavoprotein (pyridoxamine 5'-phosphate oxidase superfamily)
MTAEIEELRDAECRALLRAHSVGRVGLALDDGPVILPVNYRVVEFATTLLIALRTRPGNHLDHPARLAAFEIDGLDPAHRRGWSVLVRGTLHLLDASDPKTRARYDSAPWLLEGRDLWLTIEATSITGRRLAPASPEWAFLAGAYL